MKKFQKVRQTYQEGKLTEEVKLGKAKFLMDSVVDTILSQNDEEKKKLTHKGEPKAMATIVIWKDLEEEYEAEAAKKEADEAEKDVAEKKAAEEAAAKKAAEDAEKKKQDDIEAGQKAEAEKMKKAMEEKAKKAAAEAAKAAAGGK